MRAISIAAASAVALLTVSAYAQSPSMPGGASPSHPATAPAAVKMPVPNPLKQADVSKITGAAVYGSDGKEIGDVTTELMRPDSKKIDQLVVRSGGILGIGGHEVAMPIDKFSWNSAKGAFEVDTTAKQVKSMAAWKGSSSSTSASGSSSLPRKSSAPANAGK
ncbi:MAG TPA: PRC-barrel domain-containing protein [Stellaceae bacterium]|nr:PRC-barrel domain-containing protein [Stellaceae bacterium]